MRQLRRFRCYFFVSTYISTYIALVTKASARYTRRLFKSLTFTGYSSSTRELDRAARKDLNEERRRSKLAEQEKKSREMEKAERLAKQRELAKTLAATLRYTPSA